MDQEDFNDDREEPEQKGPSVPGHDAYLRDGEGDGNSQKIGKHGRSRWEDFLSSDDQRSFRLGPLIGEGWSTQPDDDDRVSKVTLLLLPWQPPHSIATTPASLTTTTTTTTTTPTTITLLLLLLLLHYCYFYHYYYYYYPPTTTSLYKQSFITELPIDNKSRKRFCSDDDSRELQRARSCNGEGDRDPSSNENIRLWEKKRRYGGGSGGGEGRRAWKGRDDGHDENGVNGKPQGDSRWSVYA